MSNPTVVFDPYTAEHRDTVQAIVDNYCVASTGGRMVSGRILLRDENGEVLGGLIGHIWAAWLHVRTLAVAAPVRGRGFGEELVKRAETYAVKRGCTDAYLDTFSFQARPFDQTGDEPEVQSRAQSPDQSRAQSDDQPDDHREHRPEEQAGNRPPSKTGSTSYWSPA